MSKMATQAAESPTQAAESPTQAARYAKSGRNDVIQRLRNCIPDPEQCVCPIWIFIFGADQAQIKCVT